MRRVRIMIGAMVAGVGLTSSVLAAAPVSNADCLDCHGQNDLARTNRDGRVISLFVDAARLKASVHATNLCVACHRDLTPQHPDDKVPAKPADCAGCHGPAVDSYAASVHGLAMQKGDPTAPGCLDCHGNHDIQPHASPGSRLYFSNLGRTCGECHPAEARDVAESVHGRATAKGDRLAATCTDCYAEHRIHGLKSDSTLQISSEVCGKCHASERLDTRYRLPTNRVKTFFESYHGLAAQYGATRAANCASCHGFHRILPSSDPQSSIHPSHLVTTCGKCHPGANTNFALGRIHVGGSSDGSTGAIVNRWVRRVYLALIFGVVGFLALHNLLAWRKHALAALHSPQRTVLRMDRAQRLQHFCLLLSFFVLAWSGFALKYPDSWFAWLFGGDETIRRWVHRVAGVVLLGTGAVHLVYGVATANGRRLLADLWLRGSDLRDLVANGRYLLNRRPRPSRFGRFGYPEKLEYWAVVWGTLIMGATGLMIWFKLDVTRFLPRWAIEVATTVHYYEAILACLAIGVWHFYHVIFAPEVYPLNWAWWDGRARPRDADEPPAEPTAAPASPRPPGQP
jgi:cytochrome b subunit of formate dehydrogenase